MNWPHDPPITFAQKKKKFNRRFHLLSRMKIDSPKPTGSSSAKAKRCHLIFIGGLSFLFQMKNSGFITQMKVERLLINFSASAKFCSVRVVYFPFAVCHWSLVIAPPDGLMQ